jgi:putative hydrolase of the HAD superfamily
MIKAVIFDYEGVINIHLQLNRAVLDYAEGLRQRGYTTAILSNMIAPINWFISQRGDFKSFDPVILSSQVGYAKPDPTIYQLMLERLKLPPDQCIFIDNHERNLVPAKQLGMKVVLAKQPSQFIPEIERLLK